MSLAEEIISVVAGWPDKIKSREIAVQLGESLVTDEIRKSIVKLVAEGTLIKHGMYYGMADGPVRDFDSKSMPVRRQRLATDQDHVTKPPTAEPWPGHKKPPGIKAKNNGKSIPQQQEKHDMQQTASTIEKAMDKDDSSIEVTRDVRIRKALDNLKRKACVTVKPVIDFDLKMDALNAFQDVSPFAKEATGDLFDLIESIKDDLARLNNQVDT